MQRDECGASGKNGIGERHGDRVAGDHPNIAAAQSQTQCLRHAGIGLDGGETKDLRAQKVGREDCLGPNLQNVVAQFRARKNPRYPLREHVPPASRAAYPVMKAVHAQTSTRC